MTLERKQYENTYRKCAQCGVLRRVGKLKPGSMLLPFAPTEAERAELNGKPWREVCADENWCLNERGRTKLLEGKP
jgi:hypothetical protein